MVTVLYFASVRDRLGVERETIEAPGNVDSTGFLRHLAAIRPKAADLFATCRIAINCEFASGAVTVPDGGEVAIIPPVSGG